MPNRFTGTDRVEDVKRYFSGDGKSLQGKMPMENNPYNTEPWKRAFTAWLKEKIQYAKYAHEIPRFSVDQSTAYTLRDIGKYQIGELPSGRYRVALPGQEISNTQDGRRAQIVTPPVDSQFATGQPGQIQEASHPAHPDPVMRANGETVVASGPTSVHARASAAYANYAGMFRDANYAGMFRDWPEHPSWELKIAVPMPELADALVVTVSPRQGQGSDSHVPEFIVHPMLDLSQEGVLQQIRNAGVTEEQFKTAVELQLAYLQGKSGRYFDGAETVAILQKQFAWPEEPRRVPAREPRASFSLVVVA